MSDKMSPISTILTALAFSCCIDTLGAALNPRIKGGSTAFPGEFKYMVSLVLNVPEYIPYHICGGALISPKHVLTAGHCVEKQNTSSIMIQAGITRLDDRQIITRTLQDIILHPNYHPATPGVKNLQNDIAVLKLSEAISPDFHPSVRTIGLPTSDLRVGVSGVTCGWGAVDDSEWSAPIFLKKANLKIVDSAVCTAKLHFMRWNEICAMAEYGFANSCGGDSGSPFVVDGRLVGIVSVSYCNEGYPTVFSKVYSHLRFIQGSMK